ncbi:hypothetical protein BDV10DRAFT_67895 [Aspergillus recurvatus]
MLLTRAVPVPVLIGLMQPAYSTSLVSSSFLLSPLPWWPGDFQLYKLFPAIDLDDASYIIVHLQCIISGRLSPFRERTFGSILLYPVSREFRTSVLQSLPCKLACGPRFPPPSVATRLIFPQSPGSVSVHRLKRKQSKK